jgi:hypothetical protein
VRACIGGQSAAVPKDARLVDHRYFYREGSGRKICRYTCGIARNAAAKQLMHFGMGKFDPSEILEDLERYIDNPSVTGFLIEMAVLASVAKGRLNIEGTRKAMRTFLFPDEFPKFDKNVGLALYCPLRFNFRGIDGIVVKFDKDDKTCKMFPLQVTVAKTHSKSEEVFLNEWVDWIRDLDGFKVSLEFVWISTWEPSSDAVAVKECSTRSGKIPKKPSYTRRGVHIDDLDKELWNHYKRALSKRGRMQG